MKRLVAALTIVALCGAPLIAAYVALRSAQATAVPIVSYRGSDANRLIIVTVAIHPDFEIAAVRGTESESSVVLYVSAKPPTLWWSGDDVAVHREVPVELAQPLRGRSVVDGGTGQDVLRG